MKKWTGTRILAVALCVALLLPYTAFAINSGDGDLSKGTTVITELLPLDDTVLKQTVAYDTPVEALALPDTLNVKGYVYDGTVTEPVSETMTIESVGWTSKPKYDGAAGEYLFLPELTAYSVDTDTVPSILLTVANQEVKSVAGDIYNIENNVESVTSDTYNTEDNVETVIDEIYNIKDTIDLEAMKAGLEENPKPMTLDDAMASYEVQPMLDTKEQTFKSTAFMTQSFFTINSVPVTTYPDTIVVGNDNDNNAHTGVSDGDMDSIMFGWTTNYPIEFSFTLNNLPTESAYIAIKAYDVDEESGEKDYVFINDAPAGSGSAGASIGNLSGNNGIWNTTVLQIPLSKLRLGENYVSINISPGWIVIVDWAQLILDGGAVDTNISNYSIQLDDAVQNGSNVEIASTVNIEQSGSTDYYTEYTLNNEAGDNLDTYFGSAVSEESASLAMPLNSPTGTYTVTGLIKDKATETIKASDRITFEFESGKVPVFGVRIDHTLSPSTLTNGSVAIQLAVENVDPTVIKDVQVWYGSANITGSTNGSITTAHQTVGENGTYAFAAKYILNGEPRITNYKVTVSNIDKVAPTINASDVSVMEDVEDATVTAAINSAITVSDDVSLPKDPYTISSISGFSSTLADKTVTITAQDTAGNETTSSITLSVVPKPLQLTQHDVTVNEAALTASLSGVLDYTGGLNITESGFVWGISQKPTYEVNSGKTSVAGALNKGGSISAVAASLVPGVNYYVRVFVKADGIYYYSDQKSFGIGAPQYGSFSVSADAGVIPAGGGTAVFTVSRPSNQTEGSQVVYFRTANGTAIGGVHFAHKNGTLTFAEGEYSKSVEVTVSGVSREYGGNPATTYQNAARSFYLELYKVAGGATVQTNRAKKTIALDSSKQVAAESFNQYNAVGEINGGDYFIRDDGYTSNAGAKDTVSFTKVNNTGTAYLDAVADHYALKFDLTLSEDDDGYQWIQVFEDSELYFGKLEHNAGSWDSTTETYTFPMTTDGEAMAVYPSSCLTEYRGTLTDGNKAVNIGKRKTVYVQYDAEGDGDDDWYKKHFAPSIRAIDTTEPQLIAIAPMAGGTYSYGDEVYVSLIFNEVIGSASGVTINTNLSDTPFSYVEGVGTNVLVFKGTVDKDDQNFTSVDVTAVNNSSSIRDLADYAGAASGGTAGGTGIDANTIRPTISFSGSSTGTLPKHTAVTTIGSAVSAKYAWSSSTTMPVSGWMDFSSAAGGTLSESLANGTLYLHVLATHSNGNTRWEYQAFSFQQPTIEVTVDNSAWAQVRNINLVVSNSANAQVNISMTGAGTGTYTGSQTVNVTANGTYAFTLTDDYGSKIVERVDVSRLDRTQPVITIDEYGNTGTSYNSLDFGTSVTDEAGGSGIADLQYVWTNSTTVPSTGWKSMDVGGGAIPTYNTVGTAYLHVKAVDNAGNIAYAHSQGNTVADNTPPVIEATGATLSAWQQGDVTLDYTVKQASADISFIDAAGTVMQGANLPTGYPHTGSVSVSKNGLYTFTVIDKNGLSDTQNIVVNFIDNEAPDVSFGYDAGNTAASWAQNKTVTVTANDKTSPVVDASGTVTGYDGSGVAAVQWKRGADGTYAAITNGGSFVADQNATYYIKVTDAVGNSTQYALPISGIDSLAPAVSVTTPAGWQDTVYNAIVVYSDDYSGIASAKYAIADNTDVTPAGLSDLPASGGTVMVSAEGSNYIYYQVTDKAGNVTSAWADAINIDTAAPVLTVSANQGTADGDAYNSGDWTNEDVVFTLGNSVTQLSGTTYQVSIGGGTWQPVTGNTFTISSDTNTTYQFKAVSGSGIESGASGYTVKIDKSAPVDVSINGASDIWQNQDVTLTVSGDDIESEIREYYFSIDGGMNWSTAQAWGAGGTNQFTISTDGDYTNKVKVKLINHAGIETESSVYTVKLDKITPVFTVSANQGAANGETYNSGDWTNEDVVFTLGNSVTQLSGTTYQVNIGGGAWQPVTGNVYTISADTNTTYKFKAVSGANLFDQSSETTVRVQKSLDKAMGASMLFPAPNTDSTWYNTDTTIQVTKPAAEANKPAITVKYNVWNDTDAEPIGSSVLAGSSIAIPADGKWNLKIWTEDEAGNFTDPIQESYYVDTTEPVIADVYYQTIYDDGIIGAATDFNVDRNFFNKPIRVTVEVSDALSGPDTVSYSMDSLTHSVAINDNGLATFDLAANTEGNLVIGAADKAGNTIAAGDKMTYAIIIDNHPPVIVFSGADTSADAGDAWLAGSQTVTMNVYDAVNDEVTASLDNLHISVKRWDGTGYSEDMAEFSQLFTGISDATDVAAKSHNVTFNVSGKYEVTVKASDRAGNAAVQQTRYINVDTDSPIDNPTLMLSGAEVDNSAYYQAGNYSIAPAKENDVKQSPIKAQYKLNNTVNPANDVVKWTDVPEENVLSVLEGANTVQLRTIDAAGNVSLGVTYTVNRDITLPTLSGYTPLNGSIDTSITPTISFTADEPLVKGDGYLAIYNGRMQQKVMDVHSGNNRVKLSNENKTANVTLPETLNQNTRYYIVVDKGFFTDRAGNKMAAFGGLDAWSFKTIADSIIPDSEITVLGYTVELITKDGADGEETSQTLTAVVDKEAERQHNIIAKASYSENGTDYFVKLKVRPTMSATPREIRVSTTAGTAGLSSNEKYTDVLIPQDASEAVVTISLGSGTNNQFAIKIINSSYQGVVETDGAVTATVEEGNLLNSVDLSKEIETAKLPGTTVDVTVKLVIEQKEETEIPDIAGIQAAAPRASLRFFDISMEKVVTTASEAGVPTTETEVISTTQQPVVITIDLPEELRGRYTYRIVREHNGVVDILPATVVNRGTALQFQADRFSTYSIAYKRRSSSLETISSVLADTEHMSVDVVKLNLDTGAGVDLNTLLPYFKEDDVENIVGFSTVVDGQVKWIAKDGRTYWFKDNVKNFDDIQEHWAANDIQFTSARELFNGTEPGIFSPDMSMTRAMFVTVLGRMWDAEVTGFTVSSFKDVSADAWYAPYVEWAAEVNVVNGYGNELFRPDDAITREQMAVMVAKFAEYTGLALAVENEAANFADDDTISIWAADAVKAMQQSGIINGKLNNLFDAKDTATRAEVAAVLKRFIENVVE